MNEIKNWGVDLEREEREQSQQDWVFGASSPVCLAQIPAGQRAKYLPKGEVQKGVEDFMDCSPRSVNNVLESKFNFLIHEN